MTCRRSEKVFKNTEYTRNTQTVYKIIFTEKQIEQFKLKLHEFDWAEILALEDTTKTYHYSLDIFSTYYNAIFPKVEIKLKKIYPVSLDNKRNTKIIEKKAALIRKVFEK